MDENNMDENNRYFFICTAGTTCKNDKLTFNTFSNIEKNNKYPTIKKCIDISKKFFPNQNDVILINISEMSKEDWEIFISDK